MGYGKVAPAPVRSTDCAEATPEKSAATEQATAMLRTVLITLDSVRGLSALQPLPGTSQLVTPDVKTLSRLARGSVGEENSDSGPGSQSALGGDCAIVCLDKVPDDRKAEPCPSRLSRPAGVGAVKSLEDPWQMLRWNPRACCGYDHGDTAIVAGSLDGDSPAAAGVTKGVLHEVEENLLERGPVGENGFCLDPGLERNALGVRGRAYTTEDLA